MVKPARARSRIHPLHTFTSRGQDRYGDIDGDLPIEVPPHASGVSAGAAPPCFWPDGPPAALVAAPSSSTARLTREDCAPMRIQQWNGTPQELERLRQAVERNCACARPPRAPEPP